MKEVVFITEEAAKKRQGADFADYISAVKKRCGCYAPDWSGTHCGYCDSTTAWATPVQRLDGKWAYPCCPDCDYTGMKVEDHDPANYPQPEEE